VPHVCLVKAGTRTVAGLHTRVTRRPGSDAADDAELAAQRKAVLQMLFVEGNHFCPSCEKSGHCRLQATAYAEGIAGPHFEEFYPDRPSTPATPSCCWTSTAASCAGCACAPARTRRQGGVRAGRARHNSHLVVNSPSGRLADSDIHPDDVAAGICPVGVILKKRTGFAVPIGQRPLRPPAIADDGQDER
jgi:[NiFe] hydrogenase diaphorase moiety small subunit